MSYFSMYVLFGHLLVRNLMNDDDLRHCFRHAPDFSPFLKILVAFLAIATCIAFWPVLFVKAFK